jgi:hypothetical protein
MDDRNILSRIEELEKQIAKHEKQITELSSKREFAEMVEQAASEVAGKSVYADMEVVPSLEERIVSHLKKQGQAESVDSERVKALAEQIRMDFEKQEDEARKYLKEHHLHI